MCFSVSTYVICSSAKKSKHDRGPAIHPESLSDLSLDDIEKVLNLEIPIQTPAKKRPFRFLATPEKHEEPLNQEPKRRRLRKKTRVEGDSGNQGDAAPDKQSKENVPTEEDQLEARAKKTRNRITLGQKWLQPLLVYTYISQA